MLLHSHRICLHQRTAAITSISAQFICRWSAGVAGGISELHISCVAYPQLKAPLIQKQWGKYHLRDLLLLPCVCMCMASVRQGDTGRRSSDGCSWGWDICRESKSKERRQDGDTRRKTSVLASNACCMLSDKWGQSITCLPQTSHSRPSLLVRIKSGLSLL
jgi:hypothetical protein